jgi:hypothetical protein
VIRTTDRPVRAVFSTLGIVSVLASLSACNAGYNPLTSTLVQVDTQANSALQFRVGTALFADGTVGLNTLVTFRNTGGASATSINTPAITGPAGFVVPNNAQTNPAGGTEDADVGTNMITGTPPNGTTTTSFGLTGGAFSYGFANSNTSQVGTAVYSQFVSTSKPNNALYLDTDSTIVVGSGKGTVEGTIVPKVFGASDVGAIGNSYPSPLFAPQTNRLPFLIGPPAVADFHNATVAAGFLGYDSGFTAFAATPVAGTYSLTINVPATVTQSAATFTQAATLASVAPLGAEATPVVITSTGDGGATFTVAAAPAGVTNQTLYIVDIGFATAAPTMYSFDAGAAGTFTLNNTSGPTVSSAATAPFATGDVIFAYVVGSDYDIVTLAPPTNVSESPTLPAQADISISKVSEVVYPATGVVGPLMRRSRPRH